MKVACPSCQALFEADDSTPAGPGLLLCETCSTVGSAPPPPPPPPVEGRRQRPRMPEIHFGPPRGAPASLAESPTAADAPEEAPPEPVSPESVSIDDLVPRTPVPPVPAVLDGGFTRSEQPVSVFPAPPPTMRGAEVSFLDYASDVDPVSLHDLGVVLAPPPLPPAWSGSAIGPPGPVTAQAPDSVDAPKTKDDDRPQPTPAATKAKARVKAKARAKANDRSKPSFFQVDSIPPPPPSGTASPEGPGAEAAARPPSSRPSDLRDLIRRRRTSDRPKRGLDLAGLSGGLFEDARASSPELPPHVDAGAPAPAQPARRGGSASTRARRSPAPMVAERPAPKPGSGAGTVILFVGAAIAVGVVAFQLGARTAPAPSEPTIAAAPTQAPEPAAPPRAAVTAPPAPAPPPTVPGATSASARGRPDHAPIADAPRTAPAREAAPLAPRPPAQPAQPAPTAVADTPPSPAVGQFDNASAGAALRKAAVTAASCHQGDDPTGSARVSITFAPSGRVTSARVVGPPFQGTRTGGCIALSFGSAGVPPFTGDPVTVSTDVIVR